MRLGSEKLDCDAEASEIRDAVIPMYLNLEMLPRNVGNTVRCHTVPSPPPPQNIQVNSDHYNYTYKNFTFLNFYTHSDDTLFSTETCSRFLISKYIVVVEGVTTVSL